MYLIDTVLYASTPRSERDIQQPSHTPSFPPVCLPTRPSEFPLHTGRPAPGGARATPAGPAPHAGESQRLGLPACLPRAVPVLASGCTSAATVARRAATVCEWSERAAGLFLLLVCAGPKGGGGVLKLSPRGGCRTGVRDGAPAGMGAGAADLVSRSSTSGSPSGRPAASIGRAQRSAGAHIPLATLDPRRSLSCYPP